MLALQRPLFIVTMLVSIVAALQSGCSGASPPSSQLFTNPLPASPADAGSPLAADAGDHLAQPFTQAPPAP